MKQSEVAWIILIMFGLIGGVVLLVEHTFWGNW